MTETKRTFGVNDTVDWVDWEKRPASERGDVYWTVGQGGKVETVDVPVLWILFLKTTDALIN